MSKTIICSNFSAGVDEIEQLAQQQLLRIFRSGQYNQRFGNLILGDEKKIELLIRIMVRSKFREVLSEKLERSLLDVLETVFFENLYPTPPLDIKV
jgi:hypothetical protein